MTTQMRHCVRAAQQGDKLAIEELLQTFKHFFVIRQTNSKIITRIAKKRFQQLIMQRLTAFCILTGSRRKSACRRRCFRLYAII